jgi:hypothetical protein
MTYLVKVMGRQEHGKLHAGKTGSKKKGGQMSRIGASDRRDGSPVRVFLGLSPDPITDGIFCSLYISFAVINHHQ